jgi:glutaconate CoA-transferase subunit B
VITDLGILEPDPDTAELVLTALHQGVTVEQARAETGWPLQVAADLVFTAPPSTTELETLRSMRTVGEKENS